MRREFHDSSFRIHVSRLGRIGYGGIQKFGYLFDSGSLIDKELYTELSTAYRNLSGKLFNFTQAVERNYQTPNYLKEPKMSNT